MIETMETLKMLNSKTYFTVTSQVHGDFGTFTCPRHASNVAWDLNRPLFDKIIYFPIAYDEERLVSFDEEMALNAEYNRQQYLVEPSTELEV